MSDTSPSHLFSQHTRIYKLVGSLALFLAGSVASAQVSPPQVQTLKAVVQQAVLTQPEVLFRWHAYLAADKEQNVAIGGYFPKVDYVTGRGKESRNDPVLVVNNYSRSSSSLTLTQMIYDGFFTRNEVHRLDHARMTRLFELHDASENTALEAARAYLDVLRYRQLVTLAEDNYVRHRSVLDQIQLKVKAGVGRRVDLEQAGGRFALAQANLLTENSNLHDVMSRFQRLVGWMPAVEMEEAPELKTGLPNDPNSAQVSAQIYNPALRASIENVRAADSALSGRYGAFQPRMDLRLRQDKGNDLNGIAGMTDNKVAEVVVSWNLFNGLADYNRSRQFAEQLNVAKDLRDKTCRDTRQTLAIAYNDTRKLTEQLTYLDQHQLSIEKARDAYRKQFDIGQRTLLDVLDTENELFQARRAYVNADYDLKLAYARAHAGMGSLFDALGLSRVDAATRDQVARWAAESDGAEQCPPEAPIAPIPNKQDLDERAAQMLRDLAPRSVDGAVTDAPKIPDPEVIDQTIKIWAAAWAGKNLEQYFAVYAPTFIPADGSSREAWVVKRKEVLSRSSNISIEISPPKIELRDATHAVANFEQGYRSDQYKGNFKSPKTLEFEKVDGKWLIVGEMVPGKISTVTGKKINAVVTPPAAAKTSLPAISAAPAAPVKAASTASPTALAAESAPVALAAATAAVIVADAPQAIKAAIKNWSTAWQAKHVDAYLATYASTFIPSDGSERADWEAKRRTILGAAGDITVEVVDPKIELRDDTHAVATFRQNYSSTKLEAKAKKMLEFEKLDGKWLIVGESVYVKPGEPQKKAVVTAAPAAAVAVPAKTDLSLPPTPAFAPVAKE